MPGEGDAGRVWAFRKRDAGRGALRIYGYLFRRRAHPDSRAFSRFPVGNTFPGVAVASRRFQIWMEPISTPFRKSLVMQWNIQTQAPSPSCQIYVLAVSSFSFEFSLHTLCDCRIVQLTRFLLEYGISPTIKIQYPATLRLGGGDKVLSLSFYFIFKDKNKKNLNKIIILLE